MRLDSPRLHNQTERLGRAGNVAKPIPMPGNDLLRELAEHGDLSYMDREVQAVLMEDPVVMRAHIDRASNPFLKRALQARAHLNQLMAARSALAAEDRQADAQIKDARDFYVEVKADWLRFKRARQHVTTLWDKIRHNIEQACNRTIALRAAGHACAPLPRGMFDTAIELLEQAGRFRDAVRVSEWRIAYGNGPVAEDYVAVAQIWMRDGSADRAIALMSRLIAEPGRWVGTSDDEARAQFHAALAHAQIQAGLLDEALLSAEHAPPLERAYCRSVVFGKQRNRAAMAEALQLMEGMCVTDADVNLRRAQVLLDVGVWTDALDDLGQFADRFARDDPPFAKAVLALARRPSVVVSPARSDIDEHLIWGDVASALGWTDPTDRVTRHAARTAALELPAVEPHGPYPVCPELVSRLME
ncbi:lipopolysaccharide assembly protein LapB [Caenimonas koreensis]|uniref:Tetratricopeptide repeat-containing protein n=1 Tax=Caenimonas koreensis DSM 17982 TaxID=1121255 RepID=A0A844B530_9BURK|nr:hypothetical protein [Caenimonas koreensis]MRD45661.1 hypothetical protein [Caenimonas koreensis DSM 17982]